MRLEDVVFESIHEYPSLFYYTGHPTLTDLEISRLSVYEYLFATVGNGYAWMKGGYMLDMEKVESGLYGKNLKARFLIGDYGIDSFYADINGETQPNGDLWWFGSGIKYGSIVYADREFPPRLNGQTPASDYSFVKERVQKCPKFPFSIYTLNHVNFPNNIADDWRIGIINFADFAIDFWTDLTSLDGSNESYSKRVRDSQVLIWDAIRKILMK